MRIVLYQVYYLTKKIGLMLLLDGPIHGNKTPNEIVYLISDVHLDVKIRM